MAYNPPIGSIYDLYSTYILPSGGLYATYHPLQEPDKSIENMMIMMVGKRHTDIPSCTADAQQLQGASDSPWKSNGPLKEWSLGIVDETNPY